MLTGLFIVAASGAGLGDVALLHDLMLGAGAGLTCARLFLVAIEHGGQPLSDLHRHRLDALWIVGGMRWLDLYICW